MNAHLKSTNRRHKILVIDEAPLWHEILRAILKPEGYELIDAYSTDRALDLIDREAPDLAISSFLLKPMDGLELLRAVRSAPRISRMPFLMFTGRHSLDAEARQCGATDFIAKPSDQDLLRESVRNALKSVCSPE